MFKISTIFPIILSVICITACSKKSPAQTEEKKTVVVDEPDPPGAPPKTWSEHWFQHKEKLTRVFYDDDVAIYYDGYVDRKITWTYKFTGDLWRYTKKTYGGHGTDPRLYAVFHTDASGTLSGGHPDYWYSPSHDFRNMIDVGPGPWTTQYGNIDLPTHEVFHIVESTAFNTRSSFGYGTPPNGIWGDSKFAEIFQYDAYLGLGMKDEAEVWRNRVSPKSEGFPSADSFWFRDWLYPWYNNYGKTGVLVKFFKLASENFPKYDNGTYKRPMNWGEYIHFSSAAAGANLKGLATTAFGWTAAWEQQFNKARTDYPNVTYPN
jgi:hypothetical protein